MIETIAKMLDGCAYCEEDTIKESEEKSVMAYAKENDVVVVFGASDDLIEFRGAIDDELDAYGETRILLDSKGIIKNKCGNYSCPYFAKDLLQAKVFIKPLWCNDDRYSWTYDTNIVHEVFDILEDGQTYCRGIVFTMKAVAIAYYE